MRCLHVELTRAHIFALFQTPTFDFSEGNGVERPSVVRRVVWQSGRFSLFDASRAVVLDSIVVLKYQKVLFRQVI